MNKNISFNWNDRHEVLRACKNGFKDHLYDVPRWKRDYFRHFLIKKAIKKFKSDKEILLEAGTFNKYCGFVLRYADKKFRKDRKIVLKLVKSSNQAYQHIDKKFKKDKSILLNAIKYGSGKEVPGNPIMYADKRLKNDIEVIWNGIKKGMSLSFLDETSNKIRKNRSFILKVVKIHGSYLRHADNKLQNNKSIALAAIKNDHFAWDYVGEKLKKDIKFINAIPLSFYKARKKWKKYL